MLLERLKSETAEVHARLERSIGLARSQSEHERQLELFYGFVAAHEQWLAACVPVTDAIRSGRDKHAWLAADLKHFGRSEADIAALPRPEAPPAAHDSRLAALGAAYVVEGSTLGGQFVARHLEAALGLRAGSGYSYFLSYGAQVRERWREFREELQRASSTENDEIIVRAARQCFERLERWFAEGMRQVT